MFNNSSKQEDDLNAAKMLLSLGNMEETSIFAAFAKDNKTEKITKSKILKPHPKFRVKVCLNFKNYFFFVKVLK